ncbi:phage tail protein [Cryobacterium psychrophilum]|uniref:Phage tail protein n=1 Tax=Cryobacterium psychrophilum TaxID=41988 RepID=A0A4Y8KJS5_9MICO|nr:phage tail protein [Cryobacterium psychrophilum]TDW30883.1 phage tail-like protein [Cryobacterium psychrophilum]TFD75729.1 phage tail protein [Cryobacterium psychrophilum]
MTDTAPTDTAPTRTVLTDSLMLGILPEVFHVSAERSAPLRALLAVTADLQAPVLDVLDSIDTVVHPYRAPTGLVGYLASWVDLDWLTGQRPGGGSVIDSARERDLIANAADLSATRGTPVGLSRFLHLATGCPGFGVIDRPGAFHVVVTVPATAADQVDLVQRIVNAMKPVHITHEIVVDAPNDAEEQ